MFILENNNKNGLDIFGFGENSDVYHTTTPDPEAQEATKAIKSALFDAKLSKNDID